MDTGKHSVLFENQPIAELGADAVTDHGRWDIDKARTMAWFVLADPMVGYALQRAVPLIAELHVPGGAADRVRDELAAHNLDVSNHVDRFLGPYEELYDRNPEKFAAMPADEFVLAVNELSERSQVVTRARFGQSACVDMAKQVQQMIGNQTPLDQGGGEDDYMWSLTCNLDDPDAVRMIRDAYMAMHEDSFDKTPRQMLEEFGEIVQIAQGIAENLLAAAKARRQQLLDEHALAQPQIQSA